VSRPVRWSANALSDLADQVTYIAAENPSAARRVADVIDRTALALGDMPIGRPGRVTGTYEKAVTGLPYILAYVITKCQRRSKIQPQGGAKTGHFGFGRNARHEAAASQPRFPNSWRLTGRFGPSGPNLDRLDQALLLDLRARL
jgi:plasmid stabilization system protein ParE